MEAPRKRIPRNAEDDYTREAAESRQAFVAETTGAQLEQREYLEALAGAVGGRARPARPQPALGRATIIPLWRMP